MHEEADQGTVSKRKYVASIVKYEVMAAQETRAFYVEMFLPFAAKHKLPTDPALWFTHWWDRPEDALQNFTDKTSYPWRPYARDHDWATVERYWRRHRYQKAILLLKQMCAESDDLPDHAEVHLWLGRCQLQLDQPEQAVEELTASIQLEPHDPAAFRLRAQAYEKLKAPEKAAADKKHAEELEKSEE